MTDHDQRMTRSEPASEGEPSDVRAEVRAALRKGGLAAASETRRADREFIHAAARELAHARKSTPPKPPD